MNRPFEQPTVSLPAFALFRGDVGSAACAGLLGFLGTLAIGQPLSAATVTALGAALTGAVAVAGRALTRPSRQRTVLAWATVLIVLATGRLVVSGGACLLLYFAAQLPVAPLLIGMLLTLAFALFTETRIAAGRFSEVTKAPTTRAPES